MSDDTPARSPSAKRMSIWGCVHAWCAEDPVGRRLEIKLVRGRLHVFAYRGLEGAGEVCEIDEDPSGAAVRAIGKLSGS